MWQPKRYSLLSLGVSWTEASFLTGRSTPFRGDPDATANTARRSNSPCCPCAAASCAGPVQPWTENLLAPASKLAESRQQSSELQQQTNARRRITRTRSRSSPPILGCGSPAIHSTSPLPTLAGAATIAAVITPSLARGGGGGADVGVRGRHGRFGALASAPRQDRNVLVPRHAGALMTWC
ncbi:hypothetical protein B0T26DRAFT_97444 [Lasiosphaeria miniovina]|uniref:Uncharacterized protein n=1 Tax=Lasiosphaeria miniovina TaxID=1954250 RepID=A0AA40EB86_9PEZI|nr:uncharacterized protein B0T26DRAFT_97444 [Lasiosphaeria miniovina]KAK0735169.1 hypothetical protein B0T26DRAFT_97444 [Lasiosphaeria miniovina]